MYSKHIFGPVNSMRFGTSLGIDLSPDKKSCNFDCLYCELKKAKRVDKIEDISEPEEIANAVKEALKKHENIDVITITANGEPTLYPKLDLLISYLNGIKEDRKLLILSNGSTIIDPNIRKYLRKIEMVKLSLDCISKSCFKKIDRPLKMDILEIVNGMEEFRKEYSGELIIEILVVEGINDKEIEFLALNEALQKIKPDRVDIGTVDRPPAYGVKAVSYEKLKKLSGHIKNLNLNITKRKKREEKKQDFSREEIISTFDKRAFTKGDVELLFSEKSKEILKELLESGKVREVKQGNKIFLKTFS